MKPTYATVANFPNTFFNQIESTIKNQLEVMEWEKVSSYWQESIKNAVSNKIYPHYLVFPNTTVSLSQLITFAHENKWRILPSGNGTKLGWGGLSENVDLVVSTAKLNQVIDYAQEDLTITVESGVKLADLQAILAKNNQFLPINPSFPSDATVGGIMATADSGSWRQRYGGVRDLILGFSFVRFDGQIAKAGGKVVKNVAGYDLMKLFTGSYGSLGVITEITFRVYPLPSNSKTIVICGNSESMGKLQQVIVNSSLTPSCADLSSPSLMKSLDLGEGMGIILRFQSIEESVNNQVDQVKNWASNLGLIFTLYEGNDEQFLWQKLEEIVSLSQSDQDITCKVGILGSEIVTLFDKFNFRGLINFSGIGKLILSEEDSFNLLLAIREFGDRQGGFLTILDSSVMIKKKIDPWGYSGDGMEMMRKIKHNFDPLNIFTPNF